MDPISDQNQELISGGTKLNRKKNRIVLLGEARYQRIEILMKLKSPAMPEQKSIEGEIAGAGRSANLARRDFGV